MQNIISIGRILNVHFLIGLNKNNISSNKNSNSIENNNIEQIYNNYFNLIQ